MHPVEPCTQKKYRTGLELRETLAVDRTQEVKNP
jgi:hypothetical protein